MTCGPSGASSQRMLVTTMSPAGAPLAGCLAPGHAEPGVGLRGRAVRLDPVRRARRHEHQLLVGDLRQHGCGQAAAVTPDLCGDEVRVHGERERGGRAAPGQGRQDGAGLGVGRPAAAELARDEHRHEAALVRSKAKPSSTNAPLSSSAAASWRSSRRPPRPRRSTGSSARRPSSGDRGLFLDDGHASDGTDPRTVRPVQIVDPSGPDSVPSPPWRKTSPSRSRGYGQYCPITRAVEVLGERWSLLILRDMLIGATRFNDIARGNPGLSRSLLSKRLRQLERAQIVEHVEDRWLLTDAGRDLERSRLRARSAGAPVGSSTSRGPTSSTPGSSCGGSRPPRLHRAARPAAADRVPLLRPPGPLLVLRDAQGAVRVQVRPRLRCRRDRAVRPADDVPGVAREAEPAGGAARPGSSRSTAPRPWRGGCRRRCSSAPSPRSWRPRAVPDTTRRSRRDRAVRFPPVDRPVRGHPGSVIADPDRCYRAAAESRPPVRRLVLHRRHDDGHLLPPELPGPHAQARQRRVLPDRSSRPAAGFRACKRCRPDAAPGLARMEHARRHRRPRHAPHRRRHRRPRGRDRPRRPPRLQRPPPRPPPHRRARRRPARARPGPACADRPHAASRRPTCRFGRLAFGAGFGSLRQFNDTVRDVFAPTPTELRGSSHGRRRRLRARRDPLAPGPCASRSPAPRLLAFLGACGRSRASSRSSASTYGRTLDLPHGHGTTHARPWSTATSRRAPPRRLARPASRPSRAARRLLDLDADPAAVDELLGDDPVARPSRRQDAGTAASPAPSTRSRSRSRRCRSAGLGRRRPHRRRPHRRRPLGRPLAVARRGLTHVFPTAGRACRRSIRSTFRCRGRVAGPSPARRRLAAGESRSTPGPIGTAPVRTAGAARHRSVDRRLHRHAGARRPRRVPPDRPRRPSRAHRLGRPDPEDRGGRPGARTPLHLWATLT